MSGSELSLPESVIAAILKTIHGIDVDSEGSTGVGAVYVRGRRYEVPETCSEAQAIAIIQRIAKDR